MKEGYDSIQLTPSSPQVTSSHGDGPATALNAGGGGGRYKEAEYRGILKKIWRICIADGTVLLERTYGV